MKSVLKSPLLSVAQDTVLKWGRIPTGEVTLLWRRSRKTNNVEYILLLKDEIAKETLKVQILKNF